MIIYAPLALADDSDNISDGPEERIFQLARNIVDAVLEEGDDDLRGV